MLAVIRFTRQFRHYLLGRQFAVRTDHSSLTWLLNFKEPQGRLARWMEELSQYDMVIKHRPGKNHGNADGLSRIPDNLQFCSNYTPDEILSKLPCGGCAYCKRAHRTWNTFLHEIDKAVPLTKHKKVKSSPVENLSNAFSYLYDLTVVSTETDSPFVTNMDLFLHNHKIIVNTENSYHVTAITPDQGISVQEFLPEEIKDSQAKDPDLKFILNWLKTRKHPVRMICSLPLQLQRVSGLIKICFSWTTMDY